MEYSRRGLKRPPTRPSSYRGLEMRSLFGVQSTTPPRHNDENDDSKNKRSNSGYYADEDDEEYVDTSKPATEEANTSDVEATEYPTTVSWSRKNKMPQKTREQGGKATMEMSMADSEAEDNEDSEDSEDEPEEGDELDIGDYSLPKRKYRHMEPLYKGEKLTTPSSRPRRVRAGVSMDQRNKIEKFLDILDEQNRLKCDSDADFVYMLFFLIENYDSKRRCVEAFTDLLNARNPHARPMLREYFIMHYLIRLRPQTAKKFGIALRQAVEYHLLDFVPLDLRPKLTSIFKTHLLLDTFLKMPNSRWLTNFVPDPAICLNPKLYCSEGTGHTVPGLVNLLEHADPTKLRLSILTWVQSVDDVNFTQLPLLVVNQEHGYVTNQRSMFFGLRNAETYEEWVSLLHYIVCVIIGNVHTAQLPSVQGCHVDKSFLSGRCLYAAKKMRSGHMLLHDLYQTVFLMRGASIWSMFWGSRFLWDAFKASKMNADKTCQVRIVTLIQQIVIKSVNDMAISNLHKKLRLNVSSLIVNPDRPTVLLTNNKLGWSEQDFSIQGVESLRPLESDEDEEN